MNIPPAKKENNKCPVKKFLCNFTLAFSSRISSVDCFIQVSAHPRILQHSRRRSPLLCRARPLKVPAQAARYAELNQFFDCTSRYSSPEHTLTIPVLVCTVTAAPPRLYFTIERNMIGGMLVVVLGSTRSGAVTANDKIVECLRPTQNRKNCSTSLSQHSTILSSAGKWRTKGLCRENVRFSGQILSSALKMARNMPKLHSTTVNSLHIVTSFMSTCYSGRPSRSGHVVQVWSRTSDLEQCLSLQWGT